MRIVVDNERCQGHAMCFNAAEGLYELDELGFSSSDQREVPSGMEHEARRGAEACPERAIALVEEL